MDIEDVDWSGERDGDLFTLKVDGHTLSGCHWRPESPPSFLYLFFHGLCSGVEFHANLLREIPNHGGASLAVDHVGNGFSEGFPGSETIANIVHEIQALIHYARSIYERTPLFLVGHSLGGLAVSSFVLRGTPELSEVSGFVLLAPWLSTQPGRLPGSFTLSICRVLACMCPTITAQTGITPTNNPYPEQYKKLASDSPRFDSRATIGLLVSVVTEMRYVNENWLRFPDIPVLYLQSMDDNCVIPAVNVHLAHQLVCSRRRLARLRVFQTGGHDVMKSAARKETLEEIFRFVSDVNKL
jgi:alpha-beta hydrolase superfamily lysophospholipase